MIVILGRFSEQMKGSALGSGASWDGAGDEGDEGGPSCITLRQRVLCWGA